MKARTQPRVIPNTSRYFGVILGQDLGDFHFRFPSFGRAAKLVGLLQSFSKGDGLDRLVELLDVAGYAVAVCWFHPTLDLEAGAPPSTDGEDWRDYGDAVIDELQEAGLTLPDLMKLVEALISALAERMGGMEEAQADAKNS